LQLPAAVVIRRLRPPPKLANQPAAPRLPQAQFRLPLGARRPPPAPQSLRHLLPQLQPLPLLRLLLTRRRLLPQRRTERRRQRIPRSLARLLLHPARRRLLPQRIPLARRPVCLLSRRQEDDQ